MQWARLCILHDQGHHLQTDTKHCNYVAMTLHPEKKGEQYLSGWHWLLMSNLLLIRRPQLGPPLFLYRVSWLQWTAVLTSLVNSCATNIIFNKAPRHCPRSGWSLWSHLSHHHYYYLIIPDQLLLFPNEFSTIIVRGVDDLDGHISFLITIIKI